MALDNGKGSVFEMHLINIIFHISKYAAILLCQNTELSDLSSHMSTIHKTTMSKTHSSNVHIHGPRKNLPAYPEFSHLC